MSGAPSNSYSSSSPWRTASISCPCLTMIARSRPTRSPKWYCNDVVLRWPASRLISRSDTPSMPRQANSRSAAAINDVGASGVGVAGLGMAATVPSGLDDGPTERRGLAFAPMRVLPRPVLDADDGARRCCPGGSCSAPPPASLAGIAGVPVVGAIAIGVAVYAGAVLLADAPEAAESRRRSVLRRRAVAAVRAGRPALVAPAHRDRPRRSPRARSATGCRTSPIASTKGSREGWEVAKRGDQIDKAVRTLDPTAPAVAAGHAAQAGSGRVRRRTSPRRSSRRRASWRAPSG